MENTVKIKLTKEVLLTPNVKTALAHFGVPDDPQGFQIVGEFTSTRNIGHLTAAKFRITSILKDDIPVILHDATIAVTLPRNVMIRPCPPSDTLEVYKVKDSFMLDGVCFQANEEIVIRNSGIYTLRVNGLEVRIRHDFLEEVRERCLRKTLYRVVYPQVRCWCVVGIYAYEFEHVASLLKGTEPYFVTLCNIDVGYHATESVLSKVDSAQSHDGLPCLTLNEIRNVYETGRLPEGVNASDPLLVKWLQMVKHSSKDQYEAIASDLRQSN